MTVTRKIQLKPLIAHACNPIVPFRIERREPRFCREILQTLLPRSGDVIHPLLWRGSGYETIKRVQDRLDSYDAGSLKSVLVASPSKQSHSKAVILQCCHQVHDVIFKISERINGNGCKVQYIVISARVAQVKCIHICRDEPVS